MVKKVKSQPEEVEETEQKQVQPVNKSLSVFVSGIPYECTE